jgi:hypothetical protein
LCIAVSEYEVPKFKCCTIPQLKEPCGAAAEQRRPARRRVAKKMRNLIAADINVVGERDVVRDFELELLALPHRRDRHFERRIRRHLQGRFGRNRRGAALPSETH